MEKRYQVFVSSTYEDLREERQEVMQALLELDCIPAGMELFPAANEDQWTIIKKVIDDCDYYIVIIGGRYGSIGPDGKSYTQMEYEYALSKEKPTIAFLHASPNEIAAVKTESSEAARKMLDSFRGLARLKTVRTYKNASDLGSVVSRSIVKLMKTHQAIGWVRADAIVDGIAAREILQLRKRVEQLQSELDKTRTSGPAGSENLAQGMERFEVGFEIEYSIPTRGSFTWYRSTKVAWQDIFKLILPRAMSGASESTLAEALETKYRDSIAAVLRKDENDAVLANLHIDEECLRTIVIQLQALGLIVSKSVGPSKILWILTPHGEATLVKTYAVIAAKKRPMG
jgi:hypothetical protein